MKTTSFYIRKNHIFVMLHSVEDVEKFVETLRKLGIEVKNIKITKCG